MREVEIGSQGVPEAMTATGTSTMRQRLLSGGVWAFGGKVGTALGMLSSNALLARLLSPQDLGTYFLALSVVTLGAFLGALGLNQVVVRFVAESMGLDQPGRARSVVHKVVILGACGALGVGLLYLFLGGVLSGGVFHAPALVAITGLVAVWMTLMAMQSLLAEAFRGFHDIRAASAFGGLLTWILLAISLGLLWLSGDQTTLRTVVLLAAISAAISTLAASYLLYQKVTSLTRPCAESQVAFREIFRVAGPLLLTNLSMFFLVQADLWILAAFRPQDEVAIYGAAAKLVVLLAMPLFVANLVVPPSIASLYVRGRIPELERVLRGVAGLAGIPACLVLIGFITMGEPILGLAFGDYYREGATVLALLSVGQFANVWVGSCGQVLMMTGHQTLMMVITIVSGAVTILVGLAVANYYGATGVAAAAAIGLVLQNVFMWLGAKFTTGMWTNVGIRHSHGLLKDKL